MALGTYEFIIRSLFGASGKKVVFGVIGIKVNVLKCMIRKN